jgi:hypothetical protein
MCDRISLCTSSLENTRTASRDNKKVKISKTLTFQTQYAVRLVAAVDRKRGDQPCQTPPDTFLSLIRTYKRHAAARKSGFLTLWKLCSTAGWPIRSLKEESGMEHLQAVAIAQLQAF